eukprot:971339-Pelagomonas_calceolata.AAC.1
MPVLSELLPGMPPPHPRNSLPLYKLHPELGAEQFTMRRRQAQKDKCKKRKARHRVGGGVIAKHLECHFARTDGVALCIHYRPIQRTPQQDAAQLLQALGRGCQILTSLFGKERIRAAASTRAVGLVGRQLRGVEAGGQGQELVTIDPAVTSSPPGWPQWIQEDTNWGMGRFDPRTSGT